MDPVSRGTSTWEPSFEEIFDLSPDLLCIGGVDGYLKRVNPAFERAFGYSSQELLSRPMLGPTLDLVHPEDKARARDGLRQLARGQEIVRFENRGIRADGSTLWIEWNARLMPDEGLFYVAARDMTDRKQAEDQLRQAQESVEASRDELRVHVEEQAALRRVATLVARGVSPTEVLDAVAAEIGRLLDADWASVSRYDPDGQVTVVASYGEGRPYAAGTRYAFGDKSITATVKRTARSARLESYEDIPDAWAARAREQGFRSSVGAPITVEGRLWGLMAAAWTQEQRPPDGDVEARMANFTELVGTAIANAENRAELDTSRARIVATADATRRRIERDLHDGAQQRLVSLGLEVRAAQAALPPELGELRTELSGVAERLTSALDELREISHGIHPALLAEGGLGPSLKTLARRSAVPVNLDVRAEVRLPEAVEVAAYYVVSEALTNAAKYAHASVVHVDVRAQESILRVSVRDDGVGGANPAHGSGLVGLKDRAEAIGGRISLESEPGNGTSLQVDLPLPRDETAVP